MLEPLIFVVAFLSMLLTKVSVILTTNTNIMVVKDPIDTLRLPSDLNTIYKWANENNIHFDVTKFQELCYQHTNKLQPNYMGPAGNLIPVLELVYDLGIHMIKNTNFHVQSAHMATLFR